MKNIEFEIKNILSQDIELPSKYKYIIRNALKESEEKNACSYKNVFKIVTAACACMIIATSIVYAKDISTFIYHFFNNNRGMNLAINEGYIDETNTEYANSQNVEANDNGIIIDAQDTEIKVENMLMDDYNLSFTFSVKLDEKIDTSDIANVCLSDMIITDENNNIVVCTQKYLFDNYCAANNLDYKYDEFNEKNVNSAGELRTKTGLNGTHTTELIYNFNACIYPYPKSKKLYIHIAKINMSREISYRQVDVVLKGEWNIDIDVPEKFYNREAIVYKVKSCSDEQINVTEACVYNTGMVLEFTSKDEPIWDDSDSIEVQREKLQRFADNMDNLNKQGVYFINSEYIKNESGEIFNSVEVGLEGAGTIYRYNGEFKHWQTFDLINSKATDKLTVYIDLFLQGNRRTVIIELERQ